ncbi:hypothetical protein [Acuticoccus kandeliae]|uniref:hypothetical protein n=1 Tax=Acuticoccus kandeliae TaxID=2073160 RepID=UPI0013008085|nr:hypothetical protein [Acuticoccus kandeliae]
MTICMRTAALAALTLALALAQSGTASAQSGYGDTQLSYSNGVVYDDDMVPGRGMNQPFLVGEQNTVTYGGPTVYGTGRPNSANLIGSDGRVDQSLRDSANRTEQRYSRQRIQP